MSGRPQALITGATRGIGQAIAQKLSAQGVEIYGTATTQSGIASIEENFRQHNIDGGALLLDVADADSVRTLFDHLLARQAKPLILVNNAAIARDSLLLRMDVAEWEEVMQTNLTSLFYLCKTCARGMVKARWGRIINITSVTALAGSAGQCNYTAAKAGMIGFAKSLARELAPRNITVNCVAPGFIETRMTSGLSESRRAAIRQQIPLQRFGRAEEVAAVVALLASDAGGYITGETISVNGGMYMG